MKLINFLTKTGCMMVVLLVMSSSQMQASTVTLFDFEDAPNADANTFTGTGGVPFVSATSTIGATSGTNSLEITRPSGSQFFGFRFDVVDPASRAALISSFENAGSLLIDVTSTPDSFSDPNLTFFQLNVVFNTDLGFLQPAGNEAILGDLIDPPNPNFTTTVEVPLSAFTTDIAAVQTATFFEFPISFNHPPEATSTLYFDNIRVTNVVPEPSSILLGFVGLGVVAAVRRHR